MRLICILALNNIRNIRRVFIKHVTSKANVLADALSRMDMATFWDEAPEGTLLMSDPIDASIWPLEKIWY